MNQDKETEKIEMLQSHEATSPEATRASPGLTQHAEFVFSEVDSVQHKRAEEATPERKQRFTSVEPTELYNNCKKAESPVNRRLNYNTGITTQLGFSKNRQKS